MRPTHTSCSEQEGRERATIHSSGMRPTYTSCSEQEGRERATIHSSGMRPTYTSYSFLGVKCQYGYPNRQADGVKSRGSHM